MKQVLHQLSVILKKDQIRGIFLLFLGALFTALLDTLSVALMAPFMTLLTNLSGYAESAIGKIMNSVFGVTSKEQALMVLSVGFIALYLLRGVCKVGYMFWQARLMALYRTDLSTRLFNYVMHKPYSYHMRHNTAETQRLVGVDVNYCFAVLNSLISSLSAGLVSLGIFAVLLSMNWKLTLVIIVVVLAFVLWVKNVLKKIIKRYADMNHRADAEMNKWVSQSIGGLKNIIVKQRQTYYVEKYSTSANAAAIANSNYLAIDMLPKILIDTMCMVLVFITVLVELLLGEDINSSLPMFATFAVAALRLIPVAGQVTSTLNYISFYRPSLNAICTILESGEAEENVETAILMTEKLRFAEKDHPVLCEGIEISGLGFKYEDAEEALYNDINLFIPAKKSVAFVGTTGSGKTTLADLVLGLHKPTKGKILADGIDVSENPMWWSSLLGYIPQSIYLSDDTIRANVALGEAMENIDDEWVWECLEKAQMKDFVQGLPDGLDTITGENGIRLSGGQRQRIGIARALYSKPQFLIMDEATSALDGDTEKAIVDSINALSGDITLLIIAHRLSTIENCDIVYRIENGKATLERNSKYTEKEEQCI